MERQPQGQDVAGIGRGASAKLHDESASGKTKFGVRELPKTERLRRFVNLIDGAEPEQSEPTKLVMKLKMGEHDSH